MTNYQCSKCRRWYKRDSTKAWIKSYCEKTAQYARLMKMEQGQTALQRLNKAAENNGEEL